MVDYSERIAASMKNAGVSVSNLAANLGVSYQAVKKVVDGKSRAFTAENNAKAAAFLRVSPDWLATGKGEMRLTPLSSTRVVGGGRSVATAAPNLAQALEVVAQSLSQVPTDKRQALLGVLAAYAACPSQESNSLSYLQSELEKTVAPQSIHPSTIATGQPPGGNN